VGGLDVFAVEQAREQPENHVDEGGVEQSFHASHLRKHRLLRPSIKRWRSNRTLRPSLRSLGVRTGPDGVRPSRRCRRLGLASQLCRAGRRTEYRCQPHIPPPSTAKARDVAARVLRFTVTSGAITPARRALSTSPKKVPMEAAAPRSCGNRSSTSSWIGANSR